MFKKTPWRPRIKLNGSEQRDEMIIEYLDTFERGEMKFVFDCIKNFVHLMALNNVRGNTSALAVQDLLSGSNVPAEVVAQAAAPQRAPVSEPVVEPVQAAPETPKPPKKMRSKKKKDNGNGSGNQNMGHGNGNNSGESEAPLAADIPDPEEFFRQEQSRNKQQGNGGRSIGGLTDIPQL